MGSIPAGSTIYYHPDPTGPDFLYRQSTNKGSWKYNCKLFQTLDFSLKRCYIIYANILISFFFIALVIADSIIFFLSRFKLYRLNKLLKERENGKKNENQNGEVEGIE